MDLTGGAAASGGMAVALPAPKEDPMGLFRRDRNRVNAEQARALNHPTRLRIMEMHRSEPGRSLSVASLTADLSRTAGYEHVNASEVNYHRACLQDAGLLPTE
jgi:DNA-binding transcriptional ArsR family regulator